MTNPDGGNTPPPAAAQALAPASKPLGMGRAVSLAAIACIVMVHTGLLFVTGVALDPDYGRTFAIPLEHVRASALYDLVVLAVLLGIAATALAARPAPRARAALLAAAFALGAGLDFAADADLGALSSWGVVAAAFAISAPLLARIEPDGSGSVAAVFVLAVGTNVAAALVEPAVFTRLALLTATLLAASGAATLLRSASRPDAPNLPERPERRGPAKAAALGLAVLLLVAGTWTIFHRVATTAAAAPDAAPPPRPAAPSASPNVILIVADTLRADALDRPAEVPKLSAFSSEARRAERAVSTSGWTLPAHASLFTGSYPTTHGAHFSRADVVLRTGNEVARLAPENVTLAELLRDAGYSTLGVAANYGYLHGDTGIDQGFDVWDDRYSAAWDHPSPLSDLVPRLVGTQLLDRAARHISGLDEAERQYRYKTYRLGPDVNAAALALLDDRDTSRPFLLFLNYMEAHAPYTPRASTRRALGEALRAEWLELGDDVGGLDPDGPGGAAVMRGERDLDAEEEAHLRTAYRGEVRDLDEAIGELFDALRERGLYDDAWILVTSDHGEFLGEHRLLGHSSELYQEGIAIPWLLRVPGATDRTPIDGIVQPVDLLPTLAAALDLPLPARSEGRDVDVIGERSAVAEQYAYPKLVRRYGRRFAGDRRAWLDGASSWKIIDYSSRDPELFDLIEDPRERRSQTKERPTTSQKLRAALERWTGKRQQLAPEGPAPELSPAERQRLETLGYL